LSCDFQGGPKNLGEEEDGDDVDDDDGRDLLVSQSQGWPQYLIHDSTANDDDNDGDDNNIEVEKNKNNNENLMICCEIKML